MAPVEWLLLPNIIMEAAKPLFFDVQNWPPFKNVKKNI